MGKTVKTSKKYTALLKAYFATHLEYRAVPAFRAIIEVLSVGSAIVLWLAAYQEQRTVSDYSLPQMVAYYALIPLVGSLTYVHISSNLPKQIKDGRISSKLLKPYSIAAAQLIHSLSLLINKQIIKLPIFTIILIAIFKNFQIQFQLQHVILGFTACLIGFLLHCFIDLCISYGAFWLDDIWAFSHLKILVLMTFGGMSFPLDVVPQKIRAIFNLLPFRFMYAFPIAVFQGRVNSSQFLNQTLQALIWLSVFWMLSLIIWKKGIKHYGAYGG